jgi:hypothetical protein
VIAASWQALVDSLEFAEQGNRLAQGARDSVQNSPEAPSAGHR